MKIYTDKGMVEYCKYCDDNTVLQEGLCFECLATIEGKI